MPVVGCQTKGEFDAQAAASDSPMASDSPTPDATVSATFDPETLVPAETQVPAQEAYSPPAYVPPPVTNGDQVQPKIERPCPTGEVDAVVTEVDSKVRSQDSYSTTYDLKITGKVENGTTAEIRLKSYEPVTVTVDYSDAYVSMYRTNLLPDGSEEWTATARWTQRSSYAKPDIRARPLGWTWADFDFQYRCQAGPSY